MNALLYNRSCYTLMSSTIKLKELVSFAVDNHFEAVAVTDRNVMHGFMELYHLTRNTSVKPLYGLEIDLMIDDGEYPFLIYVDSIEGYGELIEISSSINCEGKKYTLDEILKYGNILVVTVEDGSYIEHLINNNDTAAVSRFVSRYAVHDNAYFGILGNKAHDGNYYQKYYDQIINLLPSDRTVAIPRACYMRPDDHEALNMLNAIKNQYPADDNRLTTPKDEFLLDSDDYYRHFSEQVRNNTDAFVRRCNVDLGQIEKASLPVYPCPDNVPSDVYLRSLCTAGLKKRFSSKNVPLSYSQRLEYELGVISSMGFSDYFLIVWDVILYARRQNIYVGVGRGSVAGCLAAWCLGITHIDPIKYDLFFERFLNPERISMPDIDIDFPDNRRGEVIEYVREKYGHDHLAHILTFGTFGVKQLIRDIGKALNIPANTLSIISNTVGNNPNITLSESYNNNERFWKAVSSSDETRHMFNLALILEDLPRHYSTHAAGVVFSDRPLLVNCPCMDLNNTLMNTQYTMEYLEELGLIKMDFLSLKNLTTIAGICEYIQKNQQFDILHIPLDDRKTYDLLSQARTTGVFQLESEGMKNLLRKMKPDRFEDIIAAIALFRPGPMQNIPVYLEARRHPENVSYYTSSLETVLKPTFGVMVYQEQIMKVAQIIGGFSLGKADILRKAVSKKNPEQMASLRSDFIKGGIKNGYDEKTVTEIFEAIEKFGNYGFNKSHSVAYALMAYQLAYLKANYPLAFYLSLLNSVINDTVKSNEYVVECRNAGITVLPPDINKSRDEYIVENGNLRFPLSSIKGIGNVATGRLLDDRDHNGVYEDYFDFVARSSRLINKGNMETLIKSGTLDCFGLTRNTMLDGLEEALRYSELVSYDRDGQLAFDYELVSKPILTESRDNPSVNSNNELELIGFYLREHPVEKYRKQYPEAVNSSVLVQKRGRVKALVRISKLREHRTRSGEMMCFADGFDEMGQISLVFMPDTYRKYADLLRKDIIVYVEGTIDDRLSVKVYSMEVLEG